MGICIQLRGYEGQGLQVLREAIQPPTLLPDFLYNDLEYYTAVSLQGKRKQETYIPQLHTKS